MTPRDRLRDVAHVLDATEARVVALVGQAEAEIEGWATIDLDRGGPGGRDVADDELLGARCRLLPPAAGRQALILLEPSTEGRLAAALARYGEGKLVRYLRLPPAALARLRVVGPAGGIALSRPAPGPFGVSQLVLDGPAYGPHVIVTAGAAPDRAAGTIGP